MNWDYPPGATPLDPDEAEGLIPKHIVNHGQLNEWEFQKCSGRRALGIRTQAQGLLEDRIHSHSSQANVW